MKKWMFCILLLLLPVTAKADLEVHFLDVGHGDCAIIMCDGEAAIIDGGNSGCSQLVYSYLSQHEISTIKFAIASHPDADHIGGLPAAFHASSIGCLYTPVLDHDTIRFEKLIDTAKAKGVPICTLMRGDTLTLGAAVLSILNPETTSSDINDMSFVIRMDYMNTSYLFCADASAKIERKLIANGDPIDVDVIKVAHHGSGESTLLQFAIAASPRYAVISGNQKYDNPDYEVILKLLTSNAHILHTLQNGHIVIRSDGQRITAAADNYYIGNMRTERFHRKSCESILLMKESNKTTIFTREEAVFWKYAPCKNCVP